MKEKIIEAERAETKIIQKPVAVRIAEFKDDITRAIMGHELPPCVIEPILANFYNQVAVAAEKELRTEIQAIKKEEG